VGGVSNTPPTAHSNQFQLFHDSSRQQYGVTVTRCCSYIQGLSVHHRRIQINHQPDATIFQFIIRTFIYSSTCFGRSPAHHEELNDCNSSLWFYFRIVVIDVLFSWSGRLWAIPITGPTTNTAHLSPRYEGKIRGCYCSH